MRFAIKTAPQHTTWQNMLDTWKEADRIELFESAWTMLAAMAQATTRIRIACQVSGMIYRHPALLANMAATIDIISNGRLEIGLGAGWNQEECDAYGIDLPPLKERFDRFDEGVEAIVALLRDDVANLDGKYVKLTNAMCNPKPVQRPYPPIAIGGGGEKRTLRTAAKFAQHWNAPTFDIAEWRHKKEVLVGHCAAIGRDPNEITCSVIIRYTPGDDMAALAAQAGAWADAGADMAIIYIAPPHSPEPLAAMAEALAPLAG